MPSSVSRSCGLLHYFFSGLAKLTATLTRRPAASELPLSTLDLHTHNVVDTPTVPEDFTEHEHLVLSSHWQRELGLPRHSYTDEVGSYRSSSAYSEGAHKSPEIATSSKADEFASLFSVSPILPSPSPLLSTATPLLIHMSPPSALQSSEAPPLLLNHEHGAGTPTTSDLASIGELGKRRGFKGAPLFTPETVRRPSSSFLSLSSAFSPKFPLSPRRSPSTPRTPRTPLSTVTNRMRTSTARSLARSPAKSSKPALQMEPPVSNQLQKCYNLGDPFSVLGVSFFAPEIVCASVPLANLDRFDAYRTGTPNTLLVRGHKTFSRAVEAASHTNPKIRETNIYDMMVYNFQPKAKFGKKKARKSAVSLRVFKLHHVPPAPTTRTCLTFVSEEPRVRLSPNFRHDCEVVPEDVGLAHLVPFDFSRSLCPLLLSDLHRALVNIHPGIAPTAAPDCPSLPRHLPEATTDAYALSTRRQSLALDDLLALLDVGAATSNQVVNSQVVVEQNVGCIVVAH
ncbi:hypothetical protein DFH09DRAFT_1357031 [Mycena vulgaris]|nr:hypothetical protein DFH09DRAFT_1357031 [Mycena vulgaris]